MATITLNKALSPTTKSVLTITEKSRTGNKTIFNLKAVTNLGSSISYAGTGITLKGTIKISGTGITAQSKTLTLKKSTEYWEGTATHTTTSTFEVEIPADVTNVTVTYTCVWSDTGNSMTGNTTMALTKMASVLGTIASFDVESEISIPITKNVSNYYDVLRIYDENKNRLYYYGDVFNGATLSLTAYGLNRLYEVMAQNTHNFTFELTTYSDDTMETTIGTNSKVVQGYITNANPVFSDFDYEDVDDKVLTLTGGNYFVKGYSDIKISNLVATGTKGATIKYWNINNSLIENTGSNEIVLENHNSNSMTIYAVDSRGNSTPLTKLIDNFIEYTKLTKGNQDYERINNVTEQVNIAFEGDVYECNFGSIENSLSVSYKYKKTTESEYVTSDRTIEPTIANNKYSYDGLILGDTNDGFDSGYSYNLEVTVSDALSEVTFSYVIQAGIPAFAVYGNKMAIGDMFDETDEKHNVQLWGNVALNGEDINQRQSITVCLSEEYTMSTSLNYEAIGIDKIISQAGTKFELASTTGLKTDVIGIKIPADIKQVLINSNMVFINNNETSEMYFTGYIYKTKADGSSGTSGTLLGRSPTTTIVKGTSATTCITSLQRDVEEGDVLYLRAYKSMASGKATIGTDVRTYLTVQAVG